MSGYMSQGRGLSYQVTGVGIAVEVLLRKIRRFFVVTMVRFECGLGTGIGFRYQSGSSEHVCDVVEHLSALPARR